MHEQDQKLNRMSFVRFGQSKKNSKNFLGEKLPQEIVEHGS